MDLRSNSSKIGQRKPYVMQPIQKYPFNWADFASLGNSELKWKKEIGLCDIT